jgi:hypothetical protein
MKIRKNIIYLELSSLLFLLVVFFIGSFLNISFENFSANPISRFKMPLYTGIIHIISLLFWCASTVIPIFIFFNIKSLNINSEWKKFMFYSSLFFGYFLLDELILLHSIIIPKYIGIHQLIVLIIYIVAALVYFISLRKLILKTEYFYLFLAFLLLGFSVITDIMSYLKIININFRYLLDDGFKFLGLVNLFIYFFVTGLSIIKENRFSCTSKNQILIKKSG